MKKFFLLFGMLLGWGCLVAAQTYSISFPNHPSGFTQAITTSTATYNVTVRVSRGTENGGNLNFYLLVNMLQYGSSEPGQRRAYLNPSNIAEESARFTVIPSNSGSEVHLASNAGATIELPGRIDSGYSYDDITMRIQVIRGRIPAGSYTNILHLSLFTGTQTAPNGTPVLLSSGGMLPITITSTASGFSIEFSPHIVDFNEINTIGTNSRTATMTVNAPARYSIAVSSKYKGVLKHKTDPLETIPYRFRFNSSSSGDINLSGGIVPLVTYVSTAAANRDYNLYFYIDPLESQTSELILAGDYEDIMTFSFISQ